jgi:flagellar motor switch protein FliG
MAVQFLKGPQKAAAFMLSLEEKKVSKIMEFLQMDEIQQLSREMANLGVVEAKTIENIYNDFQANVSAGTGTIVGSIERTQKFLSQILPREKVEIIMSEIVGPTGRNLWEKLDAVDNEFLTTFLQTEHPQTVSVVLSKLKPAKAAILLKLLPTALAEEVLVRILRMEMVDKEIIGELEKSLRTQFVNNSSKSQKKDAHQVVADIFNLFDKDTEKLFFDYIQGINEDDATRVKDLMFTFDHLVRLDDKGVQELLRVVDKSKLALALKGAPQIFREMVFKNMSERASNILKEDMEALGKVRIKDVDAAQTEILTQVKELIEKDLIVIRGQDEAEEEKYVE